MNSIKKKETRKSKTGPTKTSVANWINYEDKIAVLTPEIPSVNLVNANDMNSIKWTVMQGIPLFYKGQVLMFSFDKPLQDFLNKYNLRINDDYVLLNETMENFYISAGTTYVENTYYNDRTGYIGTEHLPQKNFYLKNIAQSSASGELYFHIGGGGTYTGNYPVLGGFWNGVAHPTANKYYINLNSQMQKPIISLPKTYVFMGLTFRRDIFASDLKKGV